MIQIETTVTTEVMRVENTNFQITTYEQTTTGFCDVCGEQEANSRQNLINEGWQLNSRFHLCPKCNL